MDYNGLHNITSIYFRPFQSFHPYQAMDICSSDSQERTIQVYLEGDDPPSRSEKTLRVTEPDFRISHILVILYNIDISMWYLSNWYIYIYT